MKKVLIYFFLAVAVTFTACEKEETPEGPGNIPGMGDAGGELQTTKFDLPDGIELVGLDGENSDREDGDLGAAALKSSENTSYRCYGSGGRFVKVKLTLRNTSDIGRTVFFPRGLIFKVNKEGYQHGILLQWMWVCLNPGQTRTIIIRLYCLNRDKLDSNPQVNFTIAGITKSEFMWRLIRLLGRKKINYEHYIAQNTSAQLKAGVEGPSFGTISQELQDAVYAITNKTGLTESQIEFIESIPELATGSYPAGLEDESIPLPPWVEEYTPE